MIRIPKISRIIAAKNLLRDRNKWCIGTSARDAYGHPCNHEDGKSFDIFGAAFRVGMSFSETVWFRRQFCRVNAINNVGAFNDAASHEELMAAFDRMIDWYKENEL